MCNIIKKILFFKIIIFMSSKFPSESKQSDTLKENTNNP